MVLLFSSHCFLGDSNIFKNIDSAYPLVLASFHKRAIFRDVVFPLLFMIGVPAMIKDSSESFLKNLSPSKLFSSREYVLAEFLFRMGSYFQGSGPLLSWILSSLKHTPKKFRVWLTADRSLYDIQSESSVSLPVTNLNSDLET